MTSADLPKFPELNDWPKITINEDVVQHAYDETVEAAARLYSFATGRRPKSDGPIGSEQEAQARRDIQTFASQARRLIDTTITLGRAQKIMVHTMIDGERIWIPFTKVLNAIIHHRELNIMWQIPTEFIYYVSLTLRLNYHDIVIPSDHAAFCSVQSDRGSAIWFTIADYIEIFQAKLLGPIIDLCGEQQVFLERL
jgi:hypothetical protein